MNKYEATFREILLPYIWQIFEFRTYLEFSRYLKNTFLKYSLYFKYCEVTNMVQIVQLDLYRAGENVYEKLITF